MPRLRIAAWASALEAPARLSIPVNVSPRSTWSTTRRSNGVEIPMSGAEGTLAGVATGVGWGAGWLASGADTSWIKDFAGAEFQDFAGSTLVHSVGGWAALTGALILGARKGKYGSDGSVHPMPGSSMPLATLGTFILWLGWFGFNGGSQLAVGTLADASSVARIFVNTNLAAAAGVVVAMILTQIFYGKVDLTMALNGALAGLVSITAEPLVRETEQGTQPDAHPRSRYSAQDPHPTVEAGRRHAAEEGADVAAERKPGSISHQQPAD